MPGMNGGLAGGGALTLLSTAFFRGGLPPSLPLRPATRDDALFAPWPSEDESLWDIRDTQLLPDCEFWNGTVTYTSLMCSHFSLSRMATMSSQRAIQRAVKCAASYQTDCVLSAEIGVSFPAAFIYDPTGTGMRMLIAPRLYPNASGTEEDLAMVKVNDQNEQTSGFQLQMNRSVRVEYLPGGSRTPVTEVLNGTDAYCVQLLRESYSASCWEQLD